MTTEVLSESQWAILEDALDLGVSAGEQVKISAKCRRDVEALASLGLVELEATDDTSLELTGGPLVFALTEQGYSLALRVARRRAS